MNSDWITFTVVCMGTLILVPLIANEVSHFVRASFGPLPHHSILDDVVVVLGALWLWLASTVRSRMLRFGIGLVAGAFLVERIASLLLHRTP